MEASDRMGKIVISHTNERPALAATWWAMILSICSALVLIILPVFVSVIRPALDNSGEGSAAFGLNLGLLSPIFAIVALAISLFGLTKGERSWVVWVGFSISILMVGFWVVFIIASIMDGAQ
jgi:membrane protease YdiL (CAAX protease family)